ncbi:MAG: DUF302 domain-containing protein [Anaerolineae bacterium]
MRCDDIPIHRKGISPDRRISHHDGTNRRYIILGVCNPPAAHRAFHANLEAGLLLPCNVIVYEDGKAVRVSIADPLAMVRLMDHPDFRELAGEAREKLLGALRILEQRLS